MNNNSQKILSYLFSEAGSVAFSDLVKYFNLQQDEVKKSVDELIEWSSGTPFKIVTTDNDVSFVLNQEMSEALAELDKKENERDLTKASLETLSVILYKGPVTRSEIDYIRGVNSAFSLRSLMGRGYIERGPKNTYIPTSDLLRFIGISNINELPEHQDVLQKLNEIVSQNNDNN